MELFYRRPSPETRKAMSEAALNLKHYPGGKYKDLYLAEESIKDQTHQSHVKIVNCGNSAILAVMSTFKERIMIPDQGGWKGFERTADFINKDVVYLPTNFGIIEIDILEDFIGKFSPEALFLTSFAGYMAEQPLKDIYKVCESYGVVLVEDASGGIGDTTGKVANGKHNHVTVASTGSPKIINVGNGGFISTNDPKILDSARYIVNTLKADPVTCAGINSEIKNAPKILSNTIDACQYLKDQITEFREVLYHDKRGINIIIPDENPKKLGYQLRNKLDVQGGGIITLCPNYNRVKLNAVCLEIKNLDISCLTPENLNEILFILKNLS